MLRREVSGASGSSRSTRVALLPHLQAITGRSLRRPEPIDATVLDAALLDPAVTNIEAIVNVSNAIDAAVLRYLMLEAGADSARPGLLGQPFGRAPMVSLVADTADTIVMQSTLLPVIYETTRSMQATALEVYNSSEHDAARVVGRVVHSTRGGFLPLTSMVDHFLPLVTQLDAIPNSTSARAGAEFVASLTERLGVQVVPEALVLELVGYPTAFIRQRLGFGVDAAPSRAHFATILSTGPNTVLFKIPPGTLRQGYLYTVKLTTYASEGPALSWQLASTTMQGTGSVQRSADEIGWTVTGETGEVRVPMLDGAAMLLYVNAPPWDGAVVVSNSRPTALTTLVDLRTEGWKDDGQLMVRPAGRNGQSAIARLFAARYPVPPATIAAFSSVTPADPEVCLSAAVVASAPVPISAQYVKLNSWGISTFQLSSVLGIPLSDACRRLVSSISRVQSEQPFNSSAASLVAPPLRFSLRMQLLTAPPAQPRSLRARFLQSSPTVVFPNGSMSAVSQPDLFFEPDAAAQAAIGLSSSSAFVGLGLTALGESGGVLSQTILAGPADAEAACGPVNASIISYAVDGDGGVSVRERMITLLPFLTCTSGSGGGEAQIAPEALASAASSIISNLGGGAAQANPQQMIGATSQLAGLVSASGGDDANATQALEEVRTQLLDLVSQAIESLATMPSARSAEGVVDDNTVGAALGAISDLAEPRPPVPGVEVNETAAAEQASNLLGTIDTLVSLSVPTSSDAVPTSMSPLSPNTGSVVLAMLGNVMDVFVDSPQVEQPSGPAQPGQPGGGSGGQSNVTDGSPPVTVVEARHNQLKDTLGKLAAALVRSPAQANAEPVELTSPTMNMSVLRVTPDPINPTAPFSVGTGGTSGNGMEIPASALVNQDLGSAALSMTTYAYMPYNATAGNRDPAQYNSGALVENMFDLLGVPRGNLTNSSAAGPARGRQLAGGLKTGLGSLRNALGSGAWKSPTITGDQAPDREPASAVSSAVVLGLDGKDVKIDVNQGARRRRQLLAQLEGRGHRALAEGGLIRRLAGESIAPADPIRITLSTSCTPGDVSCRPSLRRGLQYSFTCPKDSTLELDPVPMSLGFRLNATVTSADASWDGSVWFGNATFAGQTEVNYTAAIDPNAPNVPSREQLEAEDEALPFPAFCGRTLGGYGDAAVDPVTGEQLVSVTKPVFIFSVECGDGVGQQNVTCGPGFYGQRVNYECPTLANVPTCRFWDESRRRWAGDGCQVVDVDVATGQMTCECEHLTDFAGRFAALAKQQEDMFALAAMLGDPCIFSFYPWLFIIVGSIAGILVGMVLISQLADVLASVKYYTTLLQDEEVIFMKGIALMEGEPFVLDRYLDNAGTGRCAALFRCMFPRVQRKQLRASRSAAEVAVNMRSGASSKALTRPEDKHFYSSSGLASQRQALKTIMAKKSRRDNTRAQGGPASTPQSAPLTEGAQAEKRVTRVLALQDLVSSIAKSAKKVVQPDKYGATMYVTLVENYDRLRVSHEKVGLADLLPEEEEPDVIVPTCLARSAQLFASAVDFLTGGCGLCSRGDAPDIVAQKASIPSDTFMAANPMLAARAKSANAAGSSESASAPSPQAAAAPTKSFKFSMVAKAAVAHAKLAGSGAVLTDEDGLTDKTTGGETDDKGTSSQMVDSLQMMEESVAKASERLTEARAWSCRRFWRLRFFVFRVWMLKVLYSHPFLSVLVKYDPKSPRTARLLNFAVGLVTSLWATTFLYAFKEIGGEEGWSFEAAIVTAVLASLIQLPVVKLVDWLLELSSEKEYEYRYASLTSEMDMRRKSAQRLATATIDQLEARVQRLMELQRELGLRPSNMPLPVPVRPTASIDVVSAREKATSLKVSASQADKAMIEKDLAALSQEEVDETAEELAWRDPPNSCVRWLAPLVYCCGRHPSQKRAWVVAKLKRSQELARKREEKREKKRAKKAAKLAAAQAAAGTADPAPSRLQSIGKSVRNVMGTAGTNAMATALALGAASGPATLPVPDSTADDDDVDDGEGEDGGDALQDLLEEIATSEEFGEILAAIALFILNSIIIAWIVGTVGFIQSRIIDKLVQKCCTKREPPAAAEAGTASHAEASSAHKKREIVHPTVAKVRAAIAEGQKLRSSHHSGGEVMEAEEDGIAKPDIARRIGCPCGVMSVVLYGFILAWTTWNLFYVFLFGVWQTQEIVQDVLIDFAFSQFISLCIFYPALALFGVLWAFVILPAWLPYLVWIPMLGRLLLGKHGNVASADADARLSPTVLTGRLQNLTLVRAAGAASMLPPDSAIIAYGVTAAVTGIFNGLTARKKKKGAEQAQQEQEVVDARSVALAQYKQELAVLSYTLERVLVAYSRKVSKEQPAVRLLGDAPMSDAAGQQADGGRGMSPTLHAVSENNEGAPPEGEKDKPASFAPETVTAQ